MLSYYNKAFQSMLVQHFWTESHYHSSLERAPILGSPEVLQHLCPLRNKHSKLEAMSSELCSIYQHNIFALLLIPPHSYSVYLIICFVLGLESLSVCQVLCFEAFYKESANHHSKETRHRTSDLIPLRAQFNGRDHTILQNWKNGLSNSFL